MIIQSIFLYVWQNKVTHYYFGGSLKSTRKMVAVSLVSFQGNQNVQRVQLSFDKNSSYKKIQCRKISPIFSRFFEIVVCHTNKEVFHSNASLKRRNHPKICCSSQQSLLFLLRMKSVQKSKFWNLSRSSNRRGNNSFPQIKTHCSVMKCHCFHVSRWHLLKVAHPINHCQKEIFGMFKKKEHCSSYGSTNFIWSDNYVIEKAALS